jgi:glycosyltransferase involved in cell wall biosynthesis
VPKFSIITPVHLWNTHRVEFFMKTIASVKNQHYKDFEWIVVDDGSTQQFLWSIVTNAHDKVKLIHKEHEERVISYSEAFKRAKGEWFVLLDSDDELEPDALEKLAEEIKANPRSKMFNFGAIYHHTDGKETFRDAFKPDLEEIGHAVFGGGNIVNGTFIWHKSVYKELGGFPPDRLGGVDTSEINYGGVRDLYMGTPYDFSAAAQLEFPEMRQFFMVDHENEPNKILKELGNPWGQDYYLFFKYTRKFHSKPLKHYLYVVNPR